MMQIIPRSAFYYLTDRSQGEAVVHSLGSSGSGGVQQEGHHPKNHHEDMRKS